MYGGIDTDYAEPAVLRQLRAGRRSFKAHLLSIFDDSQYVIKVKELTNLPIIANLRNGLWYGHPSLFASTCYFKSTDGHVSQWKFSLSRINLHVAQIATSNNGCVIVDSTRKGKRFPDSLYSTIPIWIAVINSLVFPQLTPAEAFEGPPWMPSSIRAQIFHAIPDLVASIPETSREIIVKELMCKLLCPIRPIWVVPDEDGTLEWEGNCAENFLEKCYNSTYSKNKNCASQFFVPIILLSCSKDVNIRDQEDIYSFEYIKGAGDDEENWSLGLTPRSAYVSNTF
jgi:tRNA A64-2'-O-ribosylphosphate transferase